MSRYRWVTRVVLLLPIGACQPSQEDIANGDNPIDALGATARSTRYTSSYWVQQSERRSELWQRAQTACRDADLGARPNCAVVQEVAQFDAMAERSRNRSPSGPATIEPGWNRPSRPGNTLPIPPDSGRH